MKIDLVVPLYNKEKSIERCLESLLPQIDYINKIIVVNDGSTDNSKKLVSDFKELYTLEKLTLIDQLNGGVSAARNAGVNLSDAQYVAFLDADDYLQESYFKEMKSFISKHKQCVLWSCAHVDLYEGKTLVDENFDKVPEVYNSYSKYSIFTSVVNSSKVILRKDILKMISGFPERVKVSEDVYVWMSLNRFGSFAFLNKPLCVIDRRQAEHRNVRTSSEVPYSIKFFSENYTKNLTCSDKNFLLKQALLHGLKSKLLGNKAILRECALCLKKMSLSRYLLVLAAERVPLYLLNFVYSSRVRGRNTRC